MLQNKIYLNYSTEVFKLFFTILFSLTIIAWTVRAVNFLDLIVESGYPIITYFQYSFLNFLGIFTKFIPLSFLLALTIFILRQIQENELIILWTSGVKKIHLVDLFFLLSILVTIFHLLFSTFITPLALNKSRQLLGNDKITSFVPTIRIQQFSGSFKGLTFIVDEKVNNQIKNIFLHDSSNILKNISTSRKNSSNTIIAKSGLIENKRMVLFNGQIISSSKNITDDNIIKFEQLNIDLNNLQSNVIKKTKIQETSTVKLISCLKLENFNKRNCSGNIQKEILPNLNRRIILPFFIPLIALISSFLLVRDKKNFFFNKLSVFGYCFFLILYAELIIRYTGMSNLINSIFVFSPFIISFVTYFFLKLKLSNE